MAKFRSLLLVTLLASLSTAIAESWKVQDINLIIAAPGGNKKAEHK